MLLHKSGTLYLRISATHHRFPCATSDCPRIRLCQLTDIVRVTNYLHCIVLYIVREALSDGNIYLSVCH